MLWMSFELFIKPGWETYDLGSVLMGFWGHSSHANLDKGIFHGSSLAPDFTLGAEAVGRKLEEDIR